MAEVDRMEEAEDFFRQGSGSINCVKIPHVEGCQYLLLVLDAGGHSCFTWLICSVRPGTDLPWPSRSFLYWMVVASVWRLVLSLSSPSWSLLMLVVIMALPRQDSLKEWRETVKTSCRAGKYWQPGHLNPSRSCHWYCSLPKWPPPAPAPPAASTCWSSCRWPHWLYSTQLGSSLKPWKCSAIKNRTQMP